MPDVWALGDSYEPYVGRWSRRVAVEFLDWLAIPEGRRWIDVGCGTGALTRTILDRCAPSDVIAVDPSKGFSDYAAAHVDDPRARFIVTDALTCRRASPTWWFRGSCSTSCRIQAPR